MTVLNVFDQQVERCFDVTRQLVVTFRLFLAVCPHHLVTFEGAHGADDGGHSNGDDTDECEFLFGDSHGWK